MAERIAFNQHGLFRIVPSTRHHPVTRKSCAVIPSVAASRRYASQTLENQSTKPNRPPPAIDSSCDRSCSSIEVEVRTGVVAQFAAVKKRCRSSIYRREKSVSSLNLQCKTLSSKNRQRSLQVRNSLAHTRPQCIQR